MLRCIEHSGGKVSVHYRHGELEVMVVEVAPGACLVEPTLCGPSSWHLVLDGQAVVGVGTERWELLSGESLQAEGALPCRIFNPSADRLRLLSIVAGGNEPAWEGSPEEECL